MVHLVVGAPQSSPYLANAFSDGFSPLDYLIRRVEHLVTALSGSEDPGASVFLLHTAAFDPTVVPKTWTPLCVDATDAATALDTLNAALPMEEASILFLSLDAPFTDVRLSRYLLRLHEDAWCDYTFADGFPLGYGPELLRRGVLPVLCELARSGEIPWTRSSVFDVISRDINAFDIETEAASEDYALLRLSLTVETRANYMLCRRLVENAHIRSDPGSEDQPVPDPNRERYPDDQSPVLRALINQPALGRTLPYYYQVQITDEMAQQPTYTPWHDEKWAPRPPGSGSHMPLSQWEQLVEAIAGFSPEATIAVGYRGEPSLHPDLPALVAAAARYPGLSLYVETSGIGWSDRSIDALRTPVVRAVIVELDSIDPHQYRELRGAGYEEATATIEKMRSVVPGRLYVQATRMKENEWDLQKFFNFWDQTDGVKPLIEKYNSRAGRLEDRKVMDLAPLDRIPCRHLQRDMVVKLDGTVPRCFQDLDGESIRGNVFKDSIESVWTAGTAEYEQHTEEDYPALCRTCDEYYTFNA